MNTFQKYLSVLIATALLVGTVGIVVARSGHHGGHRGGYYGGRGWGRGGYGWGGWGLGLGYGWGYGWPYYGYGWGYPGYYTRPSFAKDNAGQSYWMVYNQSMIPLRVKSDRDETIIPPGAVKKLYRRNSFNMNVYGKGIIRGINTRQHGVTIYLDEIGNPHFKL